jgi:hypothetical protein
MQTIRFEREATVGCIVLANPPFNRLDQRFSGCLREAVHEASESDIRVLVIKAEGPHFSFGGEVREWPGKDVNWFRTFVAEVNLSYRAIEALRVPTIAAVQGCAFGGGFELALSCDFIIAAENAVFRCVEVTTECCPSRERYNVSRSVSGVDARRASPCWESRFLVLWRVNLVLPRRLLRKPKSYKQPKRWRRNWRWVRLSPTQRPARF